MVIVVAGGVFVLFHFFGANPSVLNDSRQESAIRVNHAPAAHVLVPQLGPVPPAHDAEESLCESGRNPFFSIIRSMFGISSNEAPSLQEQEQLFRELYDETLSFSDRRKAAWRLARFANNEIINRLRTFLTDPLQDPSLKALIGEGLGYSTSPQATELLVYLLEYGDVTEICGAVRGLAARGTRSETILLTQTLALPDTEQFVREEIIEALGAMQCEHSFETLINLYTSVLDEGDVEVAIQIIESLSRQDISRTKEFFDNILSDPKADPQLRVSAAKAISEAEGGTTPILIDLLGNSDPDVRAEAAWGLIEMGQSYEAISSIATALKTEEDPAVRKLLYQALAVQDPGAVPLAAETIDQIYAEQVPSTIVSGYLLIANQARDSASKLLQQRFDEQAVPELILIALDGVSVSEQIQAVRALAHAGTDVARDALLTVIAKSSDPRVVHASGIDLEALIEKQGR